ncbi:sigma-70 family RNA polymerase sigma factor [Herbaspirillum sp. WKF16]|uniref:sigma-70 family RNA polymerase sigma factor n=1 Tax=Herbaspirillum sp. WKF16 TaxID=3028312 RepID=UPI0023A97D1A|nr:sigma-70 family RNA polymerase sigma factor [Herbaspirillum sp. WKF16]WDZ98393.1 sigma-70 family RNA polymerase sigma factor [Herbaspirillum sp. WKF16]
MPAADPCLRISVEDLYTSHHGPLVEWLRKKLGCASNAADLAQDTFLRVILKRDLEALREPQAYLRTIAHSLLVNHWRRQDLERAYLEALAVFPDAMLPSEEDKAVVLEGLQEIDRLLGRLSVKARTAFLLSHLEGLTYAQIAVELEVSERMVKKYMAQAMLVCLELQV